MDIFDEAAAMTIAAAVLTDTGLHRRINEDAVGVVPGTCNGTRRDFLAVVADGMGGHGHGDIASHVAVAAVVQAYPHGAADIVEAVRAAVERANAAVFALAQQSAALRGMGTTCTAIAIRDGEVACAHVGDSRLYLIRGGSIYAMTEDHSAVGGGGGGGGGG
ncbi:MAG: protein phosphatase 2C domain-containing protein, partial [Vicinamibacterales bacterium]